MWNRYENGFVWVTERYFMCLDLWWKAAGKNPMQMNYEHQSSFCSDLWNAFTIKKKKNKQLFSAHLEVEMSYDKDFMKFKGICLMVFLSAFLVSASGGLGFAEDTI